MGSRRTRGRRCAAGIIAATALLVASLTDGGSAHATTLEGDVLVFVPFHGQTTTIWQAGVHAQSAHISAAISIPATFSNAVGSDILEYTPGPAADGILHVAPGPGTSAPVTTFTPLTLNGTYQPLIGRFGGSVVDDILWYAPGAATDYLWLFDVDGNHVQKTVSVSGNYKPVVMDVNGGATDDIIWYAPGTAPDSMWLFNTDGTHTTKSLTINGTDDVGVPGHFGDASDDAQPQRRLIWFSPTGADSIWTFDTSANHTSKPVPNLTGAYRPIVGRFTSTTQDSVLWYRPGTASEQFWSFNADGSLNQLEAPAVNGTYDTTVGDFDDNGYQDIAWGNAGKATIWKFNGGGYTQVSFDSGTPNTIVRTAYQFL